MGNISIHRNGAYKYKVGEAPCFKYNDGPGYEDVDKRFIKKHTWRVKYLTPKFLLNVFDRCMSAKCTSEERDDYLNRQQASHPAEHKVPHLMLNHKVGSIQFRNAWKYPHTFAKDYSKSRNPWQSNFVSIAEMNNRKMERK